MVDVEKGMCNGGLVCPVCGRGAPWRVFNIGKGGSGEDGGDAW